MSQESPNKPFIPEGAVEWIHTPIPGSSPQQPSFFVNGVYSAALHEQNCKELEELYPCAAVLLVGSDDDKA